MGVQARLAHTTGTYAWTAMAPKRGNHVHGWPQEQYRGLENRYDSFRHGHQLPMQMSGCHLFIGGCACRCPDAMSFIGGCACRCPDAMSFIGGCACRCPDAMSFIGGCACRCLDAMWFIGGCACRCRNVCRKLAEQVEMGSSQQSGSDLDKRYTTQHMIEYKTAVSIMQDII